MNEAPTSTENMCNTSVSSTGNKPFPALTVKRPSRKPCVAVAPPPPPLVPIKVCVHTLRGLDSRRAHCRCPVRACSVKLLLQLKDRRLHHLHHGECLGSAHVFKSTPALFSLTSLRNKLAHFLLHQQVCRPLFPVQPLCLKCGNQQPCGQ